MHVRRPLTSERSTWPSQDVIDALPIGIYICDRDGDVVAFNEHAAELFGMRPVCGSTHEQFFEFFRIHLGLVPVGTGSELPMARVLRTHLPSGEFEAVITQPGGREIPVLANVSPMFDDSGRFTGYIHCIQDLSRLSSLIEAEADSRTRADASDAQAKRMTELVGELTASEDQLRLLAGELRHRVGNTLAVVNALVTQTLRSVEDREAATVIISDRLTALARAFDLLSADEWRTTPLRRLVEAAIDLHRIGSSRVSIEGPDLLLAGREVLGFTLVLHELATNALKHGALSTLQGRLRVRWRVEAETLHFVWQEAEGPTVSVPKRRGFGSSLIERALGGAGRQSVQSYRPDGVLWEFSAPLATMTPS